MQDVWEVFKANGGNSLLHFTLIGNHSWVRNKTEEGRLYNLLYNTSFKADKSHFLNIFHMFL